MTETEFWKRVDVRGADECWPWVGHVNDSGYGVFKEGKNEVRAHRRAHELKKGPLGELLACHTCDNPPCCNPAHLWAGTAAQNNIDSLSKGRRTMPHPGRGEEHPLHKLTDIQRAELKRLAAEGVSYRELGRRFGISFQTAHTICKGRSYAYRLKKHPNSDR